MRRLMPILALALAGVSFALAPALAQVSSEQRDAIRANCAEDYKAHCQGVQPGGKPALECLIKNVSSLSAACQTAVKAVEPTAGQ